MALTRPRLGQINTTVSNFTDPIVVFNAGSTQANVDQGILFNRANGLVSNVALFFSESANSFVFGFTSNSGQTNSNIQITNNANLKIQNLYFDNLFFANGQPYSAVSTYGDSNVAAYIPTDPTVTGIQGNLGAYQVWANLTLSTVANAVNQQEAIDSINANIGSYQLFANANASTQSLSIDSINANIGSYQIYANSNASTQATSIDLLNANIGAYQIYANANASTQSLSIDSINANIGAYQIYANANASTQATSIDLLNANIGSYQIYANSNASTQATSIDLLNANIGAYQTYANANVVAIQANLGAYQIFANANAASQQTQIDNLNTQAYANANVAAYLTTYSGSIGGTLTTASQPNITELGNLTSFGASFGSTTAQGNLTVVGNLTVQGNTLTIGSNNLTVVDSIIDLHTFANLDPLISDDGRDIGFRFHYYKGADTHAFLGWENNVETLVYLQNSNETNSNITGTFGNVHFGSLLLSNTAAASSTTTGALVVAGGIGVAGNVYAANVVTTDALITNFNTSNLIVPSGTFTLGSQIFYPQSNNGFSVNENFDPSNNSNQTAYHFTSGAGRANIAFSIARTGHFTDGFGVYGTAADNTFVNFGEQNNTSFEWRRGVGIRPLNLNGGTQMMKLFSSGNLVIASTQDSTSSTTGALVVAGGVGVAGNVYTDVLYTTDGIRWAGNGAVFASGGGGGGGGITYTAANTAPGSPSIGDQWYYVAGDILFEYIDDGDSNQWVDVNGLGQTATSNITLIGDSILQGNISVQNNNLYSIGAASGYLSNIFSNTVTANTITVSGTISGNVAGNITGNVYGNIINSTGTINVTGDLIPSANVTYNLGSSSLRWKDLWISGNTIYIGPETINVGSDGTWTFSSNGSTVQLSASNTTFSGNITTSGSILPTANVTQNIGASNLWWGTFYGISTQAQYADLAENYVADANYAPGTVLVFGGACEVTVSTSSHDTRIAGVVSENPAYLMNAAKGNVSVALTGRVPCQVKGPVDKGTVLVSSSIAGVAQMLNTAQYQPGCVIGKSLETIEDNMIKTIEIAVGRF